jgi:hypothetical protein
MFLSLEAMKFTSYHQDVQPGTSCSFLPEQEKIIALDPSSLSNLTKIMYSI